MKGIYHKDPCRQPCEVFPEIFTTKIMSDVYSLDRLLVARAQAES